MIIDEIKRIQAEADPVYCADDVEAAIEKLGQEITAQLADNNPVVLCLMLGGIVLTGKLLPLLRFPLEVNYVHASRYHGRIKAEKLQWIRRPDSSLKDRAVLILDDILDQGKTLETVIRSCKNNQAKSVHTAVLVDKQVSTPRVIKHADFTGLTVPDRYVFGYGMDYKGYLRNVAGIYAIKNS